jgi:hypothetical protein
VNRHDAGPADLLPDPLDQSWGEMKSGWADYITCIPYRLIWEWSGSAVDAGAPAQAWFRGERQGHPEYLVWRWCVSGEDFFGRHRLRLLRQAVKGGLAIDEHLQRQLQSGLVIKQSGRDLVFGAVDNMIEKV